MISLLLSAVLACDPPRSYGYAQPSYGYGQQYATYYQQPYQAQAYFAPDAGAYAAAVAAQVRKEDAAARALAAQQQLADQVAKLTQAVAQLEAPQPQPVPQPQPFSAPLPSPQYQAPPAPEKTQPFSAPPVPSPQSPPAPGKQPAFGSARPEGDVPPPPRVPTPAGADFLPRMGLQNYGGTRGGVPTLAAALTKCAECHTGPDAKRGVKIWEAPGQLAELSIDEMRLLFDAVNEKRMPPRATVVDTEARGALAGAIRNELTTIASTLNGVGR